MKRRNKLIAGILTLLAISLLGWWLLSFPKSAKRKMVNISTPTLLPKAATVPSAPPTITAPPQPVEERRKAVVAKVLAALSTPITFHGKVVDQNGNPVAYANIGYGVADKFDASGSNYTGQADGEGLFEISGIHGAVLTVTARKEGYYQIHNVSNQSFAYGIGSDSYTKLPPAKDNPAVFVLQKGGKTEPLVHVSSRQIDVPMAGQPLKIDLATGRSGGGSLEVQSWLGNVDQRPFDWRFRLSVSGGGLIERDSQFAFEAPIDGYQSVLEVTMSASAEKWSGDVNKSYFARLPDNRYARFSINFYPGDRNFVVLESYVNPKIGSRNLEFDSSERITVP